MDGTVYVSDKWEVRSKKWEVRSKKWRKINRNDKQLYLYLYPFQSLKVKFVASTNTSGGHRPPEPTAINGARVNALFISTLQMPDKFVLILNPG